jgi:hypothetical protein
MSCLLCGHPMSAQASMALDLDDEALVRRSDVVAVASVSRLEVVLGPDQSVSTLAKLQIHRPVRGCAEGDELVLQLPGGLFAGLQHAVAGSPSLRPGQVVLAFMERHGPVVRLMGLSLGLYCIDGAPQQPWRAQRKLNGLVLVAEGDAGQKGQATTTRRPPPQGPVPLDRLLDRLDGYARAAAGRPR